MRFVLASQSPARLRTLRDAGVRPEVIVSDVDEDAIAASMPGARTGELVLSLAVAKAAAVAARLAGEQPEGGVLVLGCDSMLDLDGEALGKPGSAEIAVDRWRAMRGRTGTLWSGHCLHDCATGRSVTDTAPTSVRFADVTDAEIELYCSTGEPTRVAGAFTIDGLGGWFVDRIEGDSHNVVGLSLPLLRTMLNRLGYTLPDLGYPAG